MNNKNTILLYCLNGIIFSLLIYFYPFNLTKTWFCFTVNHIFICHSFNTPLMNNENIILLYYFNEIVFSLLSFFTPLIIWKHNYIIQLFNEIIFLLCIFIRTPSSNGKFRCITVLYNRIVFHENDCFRKKKKKVSTRWWDH